MIHYLNRHELLNTERNQLNHLKNTQWQTDIVAFSFELGNKVLAHYTATQRKELGQFLTPPVVARYMATQLGEMPTTCHLLEPAIGSGVLACAVIEQAVILQQPKQLLIEGYEVDQNLYEAASTALATATAYAQQAGIVVQTRLHHKDFILAQTTKQQLSLFDNGDQGNQLLSQRYDRVIANPPYFKINREDPRAEAAFGQIAGHTNAYTLFMGLAVKQLLAGGYACFIVPRSFCSGAYFAQFRHELISLATPTSIHLFESRDTTFKADDVLQENIIFTIEKRHTPESSWPPIQISTSQSHTGLRNGIIRSPITAKEFLKRRHDSLFFRLPITELDQTIVDIMDLWPGSLNKLGLHVSTGPVVAFRAKALLHTVNGTKPSGTVPLLWMQNVHPQQVDWPVTQGSKPEAITQSAESQDLLIPNNSYVLTRRFSAKEEYRRLIAAPLLQEHFNDSAIGLENHLNYIYRKGGCLEAAEAIGLSALLNSALMDRYFRICNGNTQVNATELRALPFPPLDIIKQIGNTGAALDPTRIDETVFSILRETGYLPSNFPTFYETRFSMGKIQEAQDILKTLGLPKAQQNEMAALTLLVLAQLSENMAWREAQRRSLRVHDILGEMQTRYDRKYAENTRETIRRQVLHQFVQAGLVERNPDELSLATNSPRTHYALSETALQTIRTYASPLWIDAAQTYLEGKSALIDIYLRQRDQHKVSLMMESGVEYHLSPGAHNQLQVAVIEEFGPRFAPGAQVLYVGDTANKTLHMNTDGFAKLGIPVFNHDKLPDVVLYDENRNWLYLIEAVTSHGPISPKRQLELEKFLNDCSAGLIFVTAFPDFNTFKSFADNIAYETEVWIADRPTHLIHFNGDRLLGPRPKTNKQ
jgi:adenine-specific DNA-methyltransferase